MRQASRSNHYTVDPLDLVPPATSVRITHPLGQRDLARMMLANRATAACTGRRAAAGSSSAFKTPRLLRAAAVSPKQQQCAGMKRTERQPGQQGSPGPVATDTLLLPHLCRVEINPALSLALASALVSTPWAAWADDTAAAPAAEGVQQAAAAVTEAAAEAAPAPQWLSYISTCPCATSFLR